jgi:hypothetical protein
MAKFKRAFGLLMIILSVYWKEVIVNYFSTIVTSGFLIWFMFLNHYHSKEVSVFKINILAFIIIVSWNIIYEVMYDLLVALSKLMVMISSTQARLDNEIAGDKQILNDPKSYHDVKKMISESNIAMHERAMDTSNNITQATLNIKFVRITVALTLLAITMAFMVIDRPKDPVPPPQVTNYSTVLYAPNVFSMPYVKQKKPPKGGFFTI